LKLLLFSTLSRPFNFESRPQQTRIPETFRTRRNKIDDRLLLFSLTRAESEEKKKKRPDKNPKGIPIPIYALGAGKFGGWVFGSSTCISWYVDNDKGSSDLGHESISYRDSIPFFPSPHPGNGNLEKICTIYLHCQVSRKERKRKKSQSICPLSVANLMIDTILPLLIPDTHTFQNQR
jgi:hypothetical protein